MITTIATVTVLWAGFEIVGKALAEETAKAGVRPISSNIASWIQNKTGWNEKHRQKVFADAYNKAEEALIKRYGMISAYRVFRTMPRLVDSGQCESLALTILDKPEIPQDELEPQSVSSRTRRIGVDEQSEHLEQFMRYIRQYLHDTEEFRPLIEFYASEEAHQIREQVRRELHRLGTTVDEELRAVRVMLIEPSDFAKERRDYLDQIEAFLEEQEFVGFPDLQEKKAPVLLRHIFVPLSLHYESGGESASDEIGQIITMQTNTKGGE
jgi:hypothetical protein